MPSIGMAACAERRHDQGPRVCPSRHVPAAGPGEQAHAAAGRSDRGTQLARDHPPRRRNRPAPLDPASVAPIKAASVQVSAHWKLLAEYQATVS